MIFKRHFIFMGESSVCIDLLDKQKELKKHVSAIHIGGKLTLLQRKFFNVLLYNSYDDLLKKEIHEIKIGKLCELAGFDSNDYRMVKHVLISLKRTEVTWNLLGDDEIEEWGITSLVSEAVIRNGVCYYSYGPMFRKKLYEPEIYARINLSIMGNFSKSYAFALYENTTRFRNTGSTGWKDLEFWREVLGVGKNDYRQFKEFNKKVIKSAVKEVNETSDIVLAVEYKREKRRIVALKFDVQRNPQLSIPFPIKDTLLQKMKENAKQEKSERAENTVELNSAAYKRMVLFGLTERQAKGFQTEYDDEYIMANLDVVESAYRAGKIAESLPKYAVSALKNDYRPVKSPIERDMEQKKAGIKQKRERERREKERMEALKNKFEAGRIDDVLKKMGLKERREFEQRFRDQHENNLLYQKTQKIGLEMNHPVVQSLFRSFARKELLQEAAEGEFDAYLQRQESLACT